MKATDEMCILFGSIWDAEGAYLPPEQECMVTWVDEAGVGHPADYDGAFPSPPEADVNLCLGGAGEAASDPCTQCSCNACASTLVACFTDADCGPIVSCTTSGGDCEPVIEEHSSGVGPSQQVAECTRAKCADVCSRGDGS